MPDRYSVTKIQDRLLDRFYKLIYRNPLYLYTLVGPTPKRLLGTPPELIPGNAAAGLLILGGNLLVAKEQWPFKNFTDISEEASLDWQGYMHSFKWLGDLRAAEGVRARVLAQKHVTNWLTAHTKWSPLAWQVDILSQRLTNWITHFGFFSKEAPKEFSGLFFLEITKQARHLNRIIMRTMAGPERIEGLKSLIYCGISLPNFEKYQSNGLQLLKKELDLQIYPDGGHYSRNPQIHLKVLIELIAIRDALTAAHIDIPDWLNSIIGCMVPILRTFRHTDGGLAFFNGSSDSDPTIIDVLLSKSGVKTRAILNATHSGYQRLYAGKTMLLIDTGSPPIVGANKWAHSGTLAFEMSSGKDRIIVNCGMPENATTSWLKALRSTAAHSTLVVDNTNSSELNLTGGFTHKLSQVTSSRREIDGSTIIESSYDGYARPFGLIHRRLIMLGSDGNEIQGEDNLMGPGGRNFSLRFHLHPNVQATMLQDKCAAILKPPRAAGWRFTCVNQIVTLEDSIYFDSNLRRRRTQQILVAGALDKNGATIKWRFSKI